MRVLKWVLTGLGSIVVIALIGVLALVWLVDPNRFKPRIEAAVREATGRELTLEGDIKLGFFPWLSLTTGTGRFGNAPAFGPDPMAQWRVAKIGARFFPLLRGNLEVDRVHLEGVALTLVRRADGSANWQGLGGRQPAPAGASERDITIGGVELRDSHVVFVDESVSRRLEVEHLDLTTDAIAPGVPFTDTAVSGVLHLPGFQPAGVKFALEVPRAELPRDYSHVAIGKYQVSFGGFQATGSVDGALGAAPQLHGALATTRFDPRDLLASVGVEAPRTADPKALAALGVTCSWEYDGGAVRIEPLALDLDDTHFTGRFSRAAGADAVGEFELDGTRIDLARYVAPKDPASEPFVLPTAALKALRFRGRLSLAAATLDDIAMRGVTLRLLLDADGLRSENKP